jgi:hypothetical protein
VITGCLTYSTVEYRLKFNEDLMSGTITVQYSDIRSSEEKIEKQKGDFQDLVELVREDDFLLDSIEEGIYIKERKLFLEKGKLNGSYFGIFRDINLDDEAFKFNNDERRIVMSINEDSQVESNGKISKNDKSVLITWPKEEREIYIKMIESSNAKHYLLTDYYNDWLKSTQN